MQTINECPITQSTKIHPYLDLGDMPLVNNLTNTREESLNCPKYPLVVNYFPDSGLSALSVAVDPNILFTNYVYKSSVSQPYAQHCMGMFSDISKYVNIKNGDLFVDIGGNDGTLLHEFKSLNPKEGLYVNIDPSENLGEIAKSRGINTFTCFFNPEIAQTIATVKKANIITSTNVFQHLKDIQKFIEGVTIMLADNGIWVLEFPYWVHDLETGQFDQIYHEHIYYYNITPISILLRQYDLEIKKIEPQEIHGGTIRLYIAKISSFHKVRPRVYEYLAQERKYNERYLQKWADSIQTLMQQWKEEITHLKQTGVKIAAFGAAAKGCIFLNALGVDYQILEYIIDDTDIKQGKYMPGVGLEIVSRQVLKEKPVDYILILPHNFAKFIQKSLIESGYTGGFLQFLPHKINL